MSLLQYLYNRVARRDCQIERTAFVARNSKVGSGSVIGRGSRVSAAQLGKNCRLEPGVELHGSSLGERGALSRGVRVLSSQIGAFSYVAEESWVSEAAIGNFCSIGPRVIIGYGLHPATMVSTHPAFYSTRSPNGLAFAPGSHFEERQPITIGHDVMIGACAFIKDGVRIGHGAIVGAGAAVVRDVEDYAIVAGVPARPLRYRFAEDLRVRLLKSQWWDLDFQTLAALQPLFVRADPVALLEVIEQQRELQKAR